jgi:phosphocarrier protein
LSGAKSKAVREAKVANEQGLHARPVMRFVDLASKYQSKITVANVSRRGEKLDGKSAMQMMLLEATQGNTLRIEAEGADAPDAVDALAAFVEAGCPSDAPTTPEPRRSRRAE